MRLWAGQAASFVGDAVSMVALVVLIVQITGSASAVGGALVARVLPTLASPFFGVLADRLDRRMVLVASDLARALLAVGFVFARDLAVLYVLIFLMGAARALFNPTVRAAFPGVVGGGDLTRANSLISATFSVSVTAGPALGGLLVAGVGVGAAFLLDAATFLFSAALLYRLPLSGPEAESEESFLSEFKAGLGYLAGARVPLAMVAGAFLTVLATDLATPAEVFLAKQTFGTGDAGYGLLLGVWGAGMAVGSACMGVLGDRVPLLPIYFIGIFAWALALLGTATSPIFAAALGALAVAGVANGVDNVVTDTVLQRRVPEALLGRVFSVRFTGYSAAEALAYPLGGLFVDTFGPRPTYALSGLVTAGVGVLILLFLLPALLARPEGTQG
ncbi:MFS transporter [Rubrobacter tropicus]|uniref:MFS transporter n=2 Tax=Rubrobacter tropicus TaxID=2653851 RepID=A0A6G8QCZ9_9ACTN|nr:MFS transporter [Rubrobacter tropicus]